MHDLLEAKVAALKAEFPGVTFGYLGNLSRHVDDRNWYVFLPRTGGNRPDMVGGYSTAGLPRMLEAWDRYIVPAVRRGMAADGGR